MIWNKLNYLFKIASVYGVLVYNGWKISSKVPWAYKSPGGGGTQYKRPYEDVPPTWVAKSTSWYMNDYYKMQNLVYE